MSWFHNMNYIDVVSVKFGHFEGLVQMKAAIRRVADRTRLTLQK